MKILEVISTPPYAWASGGCARVTYEISKELVRRGHEVTILTTDMHQPKHRYIGEQIEYIDGIKVIRCKSISNYLAWKYKLYFSPGIIFYIKKHLKEFDIVHLQDLISIHAIYTNKYCNKYNVPYILTTHGSIPWLLENNRVNHLYFDNWGKNILFSAKKIIALTNNEYHQIKSTGVINKKIKIIPNAIDLSDYENLPSNGTFKSKFGIHPNQKIILFLGRIHKIKGINLLLDSYAEIIKEIGNVKLVIAGPEDGFLNTLEKQIVDLNLVDKVLLTGPLYDQDKLSAYVDCDVYVLPSIYETFPMTVLEACACGKPVIITDRCGIADIVNNSVGLVVKYDKTELKNAILKILSDPDLNIKFGQEGKKLVYGTLNWKNVSIELERLYLEVLNENNNNANGKSR